MKRFIPVELTRDQWQLIGGLNNPRCYIGLKNGVFKYFVMR